MSRFTSEDLMKAMGLQVGDRVKVEYISQTTYNTTYVEYEVKYNEIEKCYCLENETDIEFFGCIVDYNYEILPRPKRVGDTLCEDCECAECHLRCLPHCNQLDSAKETLFNILDGWNKYDTFDQEIHDLLKARLDKVVE